VRRAACSLSRRYQQAILPADWLATPLFSTPWHFSARKAQDSLPRLSQILLWYQINRCQTLETPPPKKTALPWCQRVGYLCSPSYTLHLFDLHIGQFPSFIALSLVSELPHTRHCSRTASSPTGPRRSRRSEFHHRALKTVSLQDWPVSRLHRLPATWPPVRYQG